MSRDFLLLVFFMNQFPPSPMLSTVYHKGRFEFFRKFAEIFTAQGAPLVSTKKSSIIKVLISVFGHLWEVELTYRYILAFKFTLRSQQPDIFPIICHRSHWHRRQICRWCRWYRWQKAKNLVTLSLYGEPVLQCCIFYANLHFPDSAEQQIWND